MDIILAHDLRNFSSAPSSTPDSDEAADPIPTTAANESVEDFTSGQDISSPASMNDLKYGVPVVKARPYQKEMMEESLSRNVIVAMDTGSGKTHVAVLRMLHELDQLPVHQIIWFLTPTVSLGNQQFEYIKSQITSVQVKFLSGADNVERWTEQYLWDAVLDNVKIIISTYQILLEALTHGFVRMEKLGMVVFDEVHNCVKNNPGSKLMRSFYHPRKSQGLSVPHILGLTASPVMRSNPDSVSEIEQTLDAICRTPKKHRAELLLQVKLPVLSEVRFRARDPEQEPLEYSQLINDLGKVYANLKISEDPYVVSLRRNTTERSKRQLEIVYLKRKTWCSEQMKSFYNTSLKIFTELGAWAADYYISEVLSAFEKIATEADDSLGGSWNVSNEEKRYIAEALRMVGNTREKSFLPKSTMAISDKFRKLIDTLSHQDHSLFRGIVFVQERAVVSVLTHLLSIHPETRDLFMIGLMVGTSSSSYRGRNIADFVALDSKTDTLTEFRSGKINLLIATSVLEEGIDVPACNVVICFQKPVNLKSFVQRRGRARQRDSKLIIMMDSTDTRQTEWRQLEEDMRRIYADDQRLLQEMAALEEEEVSESRSFQVEKTEALLDLDNAVSHLYHFCATLPAKEYVDLRPEFICTNTETGQIRARVILPLSVDVAVRFASSQKAWTSEKAAIKDAAFEAYLALYRAGLINDNLLPLLRHGIDITELTTTEIETRAPIMNVTEQMNPWDVVSDAQNDGPANFATVTISTDNMQTVKMLAHMPKLLLPVPSIKPFKIYWDHNTEFDVAMDSSRPPNEAGYVSTRAIQETWILLDAAFGHRFRIEQEELIVCFATAETQCLLNKEHVPAAEYSFPNDPALCPLVYQISEPKVGYIFKDLLPGKPQFKEVQNPYENYDVAPNCPHLSVTRLHRRTTILNKLDPLNQTPTRKLYSVVLPINRCTVGNIPFKYLQFGLFIPAIIYQLTLTLLAQHLSTTLLSPLKLPATALSTILTAITASSSGSPTNYQRLEFLGDSILKLCTSVQLMAAYPHWHEGYLSAKKDRLVANSRLSRACVETGLDKYIVTKPFRGAKWRPTYVKDLAKGKIEAKRNLGSKVVADVVESTIGAAMVTGGLPMALRALQIFLPDITWEPLEDRRIFLFTRAPDLVLPPTLAPIEALIGHPFRKPSLLVEAMTHASYATTTTSGSSQSLERFEFLGDSILDNIIVEEMYAYNPELTHFQMHVLRTAMVNADLLAFVCMEFSINTPTSSIDPKTNKPVQNMIEKPLYKFLRHTSPTLAQSMKVTEVRHALLRTQIKSALQTGTHFPWALLARLEAQKFYSDIIESVLGALWIDTGSFQVCKDFIAELGVLPYLRRILTSQPPPLDLKSGLGLGLGIHVWHPKEQLGVLAGNKKVVYTLFDSPPDPSTADSLESGAEDDGIKGNFSCHIAIGGERLLTCANGVNRNEILTRAAERAVSMLTVRVKEARGVDERGKVDEEMEGVVMDPSTDTDSDEENSVDDNIDNLFTCKKENTPREESLSVDPAREYARPLLGSENEDEILMG